MLQDSFRYGDRRIAFQVVYTEKQKKSVAIHVNHDGSVQVDAPKTADIIDIKEAVKKRGRWIVNHVQQSEEIRKNVLKREYVSGETHFYLGRQYVLKVFERKRIPEGVKLIRGRLEITTRTKDAVHVKALLDAWYDKKTQAAFKKRLEAVVADIKWIKKVPDWKIRTMKKQWGSCSPKGNLSLNPALIKAPRECIDYVIIHELCHLKERKHDKKYYALLGKTMPEWEGVKARLDGMSELLLNS